MTEQSDDFNEPTDQVDNANETTDQVDDANEPTDPVDDANEPTDPVDDTNEPTDPVDDANESTDQVDDADETTDPVDDVNEPVDLTRPRLHIGAAYYPEHWPESRWGIDVGLMKELGLSVVRMAEFAWSSLEPSEGDFHFDWLDRAIDLLAENGIVSVLGTPTAAPPAWLCQQHPDLMAVDENGLRVQFGNRVHYCVNSPQMHAASQRVIAAMAEHFGPNRNVIGWQIDNEFSRVCYCSHCQDQFRRYLEEKFGSLDELNHRWSTSYWSQTYSAWDQIPLPIGEHNPGLMLEFKRFTTRSYREFQKLQIDALRPWLKPSDWITHNYMGWFDGLDHYEMAADLDMASWDWYVGTGHNDHLSSNAAHDLIRGFKNKNFWVMETQPGMVSWAQVNNPLNKGEGRTMAWQAVAHGAEAFLYWQWRSAPNGQEQLHGSLIDQSGQPRPFYTEVKRIATEFAHTSELITGSHVKARVAILNDYESRWAIDWQRHHESFDYVEHLLSYYRPIAANNVLVDIISADSPLDGYKLVIAPSTLILDERRVNNIKAHVEHGGYLIITPRTGVKDRDNSYLPTRPPGPLTGIAGIEVLEGYALDQDVPVKGNWFSGMSRQWADLLNATDKNITIPAARYENSNGWLDEQTAISVHGYRSGLVYTVGTYLDENAQKEFISRVLKTCAQSAALEVPAGVQVAKRVRADGQEIIFVINHTREKKTIDLKNPYREHLKDLDLSGIIEMAPYGIAVLTRSA